LTRRALVDLFLATAFVWVAVLTIHKLDLSAGLAEWNATHQDWAIDEFTLVSLCVAVALGVFSWRRWQESARMLARHQATLDQLHTTEDRVASQDDLIRSVSHELRTPLTAVLGYAELLGGTDLETSERTEVVDTIIREGRDLSNIVEDLITRARSEAATLEVALVQVSLASQAAQVLESRSPADRDRIALRLDPEALATGDPARVRQILRNLLSNAFKYGEGGVEISAIAKGDTVGLSVSNRGKEISESDRERIFDPYHRVPGNGPKPGGLGLGLAISRQLARLMGGELSYRYESGRSFFDLSLTRFEESPDELAAPTSAEDTPYSAPTEDIPVVSQEPIGTDEIPAESDQPAGFEEAPSTPQPPAWTAEIPDEPETPIQIQEIPKAPEASAWVEDIPEAPEAPTWIEETPDTPDAPTWVEEIRDLSEPPPWMNETPDRPEAAIELEEIRDASEAPVRVGEGPFDFLGFGGQDQRL
jgi:signal transduction histidine kinase